MKLVPITQDEIRNAEDKEEALRIYHKWLQDARNQDRKEHNSLLAKIRRFEYKKEGKCTMCGKINDRDSSYCTSCKNRQSSYGLKKE